MFIKGIVFYNILKCDNYKNGKNIIYYGHFDNYHLISSN